MCKDTGIILGTKPPFLRVLQNPDPDITENSKNILSLKYPSLLTQPRSFPVPVLIDSEYFYVINLLGIYFSDYLKPDLALDV